MPNTIQKAVLIQLYQLLQEKKQKDNELLKELKELEVLYSDRAMQI